jgi:hypothetical protein
MKIQQLKKELKLSNKQIAEFFSLSLDSYQNSSARKRYENALCEIYEVFKKKGKEKKD